MNPLHHFQEAFKFAIAVCLAYGFALWMDWQHPAWAVFSVMTCSLATAGAALERGMIRVVGTAAGGGLGLLMVSQFSQHPLLMYVAEVIVITGCTAAMLMSRFWSAWLCVAFTNVLIVASSYPNWTLSPEIALERVSETVVGVLAYMLVSALLWQRFSGDSLQGHLESALAKTNELYALVRREQAGTDLAEDFLWPASTRPHCSSL